MTTDFEKIPEVVFELFREICWDREEHGPPVLRPGERSKAMMVAYGWNPPLIDDMRVRDGRCASYFTEHGLAAYAWRELQVSTEPKAADAFWLSYGVVQVGDGDPIKLPEQFASVLEELVRLRAADSAQLDRIGGGAKKLREMLGKFPALQPYVKTPRRKGAGGYSTTIRKVAIGAE
jgi:hypothetical protein